jgi:hypothetical protein
MRRRTGEDLKKKRVFNFFISYPFETLNGLIWVFNFFISYPSETLNGLIRCEKKKNLNGFGGSPDTTRLSKINES